MNAFYERLTKFGALINEVAERSGEHMENWFTVIHPGHPVVSQTRRTTPKLHFEESCPVNERRKIRQMLRKAFRSRTLENLV